MCRKNVLNCEQLLSHIFLMLPTFCGENKGNMSILQHSPCYKKLVLTLPAKYFLNLNFFQINVVCITCHLSPVTCHQLNYVYKLVRILGFPSNAI